MDDIAAQAGVAKPTLYRYFRSKDELYSAVFVQALDELERQLAAVLRRRAGVRDELEGLVAAIAPMVRNHLAPLPGLSEGDATADYSRRRIFRERRARLAQVLSGTIERGIRSGELTAAEPSNVAQMMLGMIRSAAAATDLSDAEIAREVSGLVTRGLAHGPDTADRRPSKITRSGQPAGEMKARVPA